MTKTQMSPRSYVTYDRGGIWAIKSYKTPKMRWKHLQSNNLKYDAGGADKKKEKVNILIEEALKKKSIPAPNEYIK